jgi:tetratricopeptide (TPR) repeat protein
VYFRKGDLHQAIPLLEHGLGLSQVVNTPGWFFIIAFALVPAYARSGRLAEALRLLEQAVARGAMLLRGHASRHDSLRVTAFSEAYLLAGRLEEASAHAREALVLARTRKERGNEAWSLRLLGEIAAQHQPLQFESAEDYYCQALALADALGMRPLQAHCHRGLGTLYATLGQQEQARTELSAAIVLYRAMDMTFWLPQTEAALAQVEGQ